MADRVVGLAYFLLLDLIQGKEISIMGAFTYFMPIVLSGLYTLMLLQYLAESPSFPVVVLALANLVILIRVFYVKRKLNELEK